MMDKMEYKEKMKGLLSDRDTYKTIRMDPTQKLLRRNNNIVNDLYKRKNIDNHKKYQLTCTAATAPRLYGLPKIHKENTPLRPISAFTNVPCYKLSKFIGQTLKEIVSHEYNVHNSFQLKDRLKNIRIEEDEILISFDVVSLFTNIPVQFAIRIIMEQWTSLQRHTTLTRKQFLTTLEFCLRDNNYFLYDGTYYQQVHGMPMGNPLSPTVADIVLDKILDDSIAELKTKDIYIKYINKYVDDIFAIVKKNDVEEILKVFNSQRSKIQFTTEVEDGNKLAFLDVEVHRSNNIIKTNWYAKSVASSRMINYHSNHPWTQKKNTAINLINKIYALSDHEFRKDNGRKIRNILYKNGYPNEAIERLIATAKNKPKAANLNTQPETTNNKRYTGVTYIQGLTDSKTIQKSIQNKNITFAHKPNSTINRIFSKIKDEINKEQQHNVVYEIQCNGKAGEACNKIYIGTTKRALGVRISEHKTDARNKKTTTALAQHLTNSGHTADFENAKILDVENKDRTRLTLESLRIQQKIQHAMNFKEDVDNINCAYRTAITCNRRTDEQKYT
ncbi:uncharacterized protein LOC118735267 [Rhagoletis pomonella]|uniref:uncharacterized protein LOC118735267 n=1 Tax=Rhagoletis pomonella TaxID=28610 RepID=UPI0017862190|nr:uncharacterized protein LOC118735267 [Rhagoletis pomonella]